MNIKEERDRYFHNHFDDLMPRQIGQIGDMLDFIVEKAMKEQRKLCADIFAASVMNEEHIGVVAIIDAITNAPTPIEMHGIVDFRTAEERANEDALQTGR